jgi:hypothetical protein
MASHARCGSFAFAGEIAVALVVVVALGLAFVVVAGLRPQPPTIATNRT